MQRIFLALIAVLFVFTSAAADSNRSSFETAIYIMKDSVNALADLDVAEREYDRVFKQLDFDKVYLEVYRGGELVDESALVAAIEFFESRGIKTATGITPEAGSRAGQFNALNYENPEHRRQLVKATQLAAKHFEEIILDDFFFFNSKTDANIKAKGDRSWTRYRLDTMREVSRDLVTSHRF